MFRGKRKCTCINCGKEFEVEVGDNLKKEDIEKMMKCRKCRLLEKLKKRRAHNVK